MPSKLHSAFFSMRGHHVALRVRDFEGSKNWFVEKLDFRVLKVWWFKNRQHAYLAPPNDNMFHLEILGGAPMMRLERVYVDLKDSLCDAGYHHFCLIVDDISNTIDESRRRGVSIVEEPFNIVEINRRLAFFADPWGNLIELAQVLPPKTQHKLNKRAGMRRSR